MFMLAKRYAAEADPTGWWLSEKLDGYRTMWTGTAFVSREGHEFPAPPSWRAAMPSCALDGELWIGRGRFNDMAKAVRCSDWSELRFMVHDMPEVAGRFEDRQAVLAAVALPSFCSVIEQTRCDGRDHLQSTFDEIVNAGGEGVMLRAAGSQYDRFRSPRLLKLKQKGIE